MLEAELYPAVERFLNLQYAPGLKPRYGAHLPLVAITATAGAAALGTWSRPDLAMINLWRYKFQPTQTLDLHGFEVKRFEGCDLKSVHETLAHTRLVHFAHLVWHHPRADLEAEKFRIILDNCREYGLGLITFGDPDRGDSFRVHVEPRRGTPSEAVVNDFIETRFPAHQQDRLLAWIREGR